MDESLPYRVSNSVGILEKCKKCRDLLINDGNLQIAIMAQSNDSDCKYPVWYHQQCFFKVRLPPTEAAFDGFAKLRYTDQIAMRKDLGIEIEPQAMALEAQIRKENEEYFAIYDYIKTSVSPGDRFAILKANGQAFSVPSEPQIIHQLAEIIYFGVPHKCPKCQTGQLLFCNWIYKCSNQLQWSSCGNEVKQPARSLATIPDGRYDFLQKKRGVRVRTFHQFRFFDEHGNDIVYGPYKKPPLFNMEFVLIGDFSMARVEIELMIRKMGGKISTKVYDRVAAIISNADEIRKMDKPMRDARMYDIQVVPESFLHECQSPDVDPIGYILSESICDWGGYPYDRITECSDVVSRMEAELFDSTSKNTTYKWKGGAAVDPECGLFDNVHVYSTKVAGKTVYYSDILAFVDIQNNKNSYYRLQLLESNGQNTYWVFESWGRTGTTIRSKKLRTFASLAEAHNIFRSVFESQTGNKFDGPTFQKQPNKFYQLDVNIQLPIEAPKVFDETNLSKPVYDLMEMLFDIKKVEKTMVDCDLDLTRMPLGQISTVQIKMAMTTLQQIEALIQRNAPAAELLAASNKFYTLVPHSFGLHRPPIIASNESVSAKSQMLENLLNVDIIQGFLDGENAESIHPLDLCYVKLNTTIVPIEKHTETFQKLCQIVQNSAKMEVLEIFKVERESEIDHGDCHINFKFRNHQLLWHGSKLSNFANILANGLKIAPREALSTGQAHGYGIYFGEAASVSAVYSFGHNYAVNGRNDIGLMLLCEVALGIPQMGGYGMPISITDTDVPLPGHMRHAWNTSSKALIYLPNEEFQSIQSSGRGAFIASNQSGGNSNASIQYEEIDGVRIANSSSNAFIVFDPNQVKIRYLLKMKFSGK